MKFETIEGIYRSQIRGEDVKVKFPRVKMNDISLNQRHDFQGRYKRFSLCLGGSPPYSDF